MREMDFAPLNILVGSSWERKIPPAAGEGERQPHILPIFIGASNMKKLWPEMYLQPVETDTAHIPKVAM